MGTAFTPCPGDPCLPLDQPKAEGAPLNTASPEFLALNPIGQIPVLVEGDLGFLSESLAITSYLARAHGGTLGPASPMRRAR